MTRKLPGAALAAALGATMLLARPRMKGGRDAAAEQTIQKLETRLWQAWKDHNAWPFEEHLTTDSVNLGSTHERGKANIVKSITSPNCKVADFSLSGFAYQWLDADAVIVTYVGTQKGVCNGSKIPSRVNASSGWVKRGGKWMNAFHQESPAL